MLLAGLDGEGVRGAPLPPTISLKVQDRDGLRLDQVRCQSGQALPSPDWLIDYEADSSF